MSRSGGPRWPGSAANRRSRLVRHRASYEEAREALTPADRLRLDTAVVDARDMLVYRVLVRDQAAIVDLIQAVLTR
ncbi:hypothetical protein AB0L64_19865 [Kribbella sp. NPDC051936]|uniref:hypothetical protein n=1 Tax=Kribbella sp. NPDC051936 TaxID=3154946 RepID=UPI0034477314